MNAARILNSIKADFKFQLKHGFYYAYIAISLIYIIVLNFIGEDALRYVVPILIYTDPAALGLFFIGGMILLEMEQGVLSLLYITPIKVYEYIISKIITLSFISVVVGFAISLASVGIHVNYLLLFIGTFMSSMFYTLIGVLIVSTCKSVNEYLLDMVPVMLLVILPCISFMELGFMPAFINKALLFIPSAGGLNILMAAFIHINTLDIIISLLGLIIINAMLVKLSADVLTKKVIISA